MEMKEEFANFQNCQILCQLVAKKNLNKIDFCTFCLSGVLGPLSLLPQAVRVCSPNRFQCGNQNAINSSGNVCCIVYLRIQIEKAQEISIARAQSRLLLHDFTAKTSNKNTITKTPATVAVTEPTPSGRRSSKVLTVAAAAASPAAKTTATTTTTAIPSSSGGGGAGTGAGVGTGGTGVGGGGGGGGGGGARSRSGRRSHSSTIPQQQQQHIISNTRSGHNIKTSASRNSNIRSSSSNSTMASSNHRGGGGGGGVGGSSGLQIGSAWFQRKINLRPQHRGVHLVTEEILRQMPELGQFSVGLCHVQIF
ncbi:unnamed protein product [Ceratitis capitata]|uniref:(Mediterranean fruit fly) hypothetical protein n=1 Tax=Ceratitis capitata TaxID=7213 RepID=A0A811UIN2_CERCA|nr:unnamed protein product [Ceratitis capitata]